MLTFNKLNVLMKKRKISKEKLRIGIGVSSATSSRLFKNGDVSMEVIAKICHYLGCQPGDIIEYVKDNPHDKSYSYNWENTEKKRRQYNMRRKHLEKARIRAQTRRAVQMQLDAALTEKQWEEIKNEFNCECAYCGSEVINLEQDHFIPLSKGGSYTKGNILPVCKSCNVKKKDKDFFEWYPKQFFYTKEREQEILEYIKNQGGLIHE